MNPQLRLLVDLQKIDDEIADLNKSLAAIPPQIESARTEMNARKKKLDDANDEITALQNKRKDLEMEVQSENDHMSKSKMKLPTVKTNKEYTAILKEIDTIKEKVSALEDRELEIMEQLEGKEGELPAIQELCREEENHFNQYKSQKEAESERVQKDLDSVLTRREEILGRIEAKLAQDYEKVAKHRGDRAVVCIKDGVCQGCHQQLLPQTVIEVKTGEKLHHCLECSRILFWEEESEAAPSPSEVA